MIVSPTTVSPLVTSGVPAAWRTASLAVPTATATTATPAVSVSLGQPATLADVQTYAMPGRTAAAPAWERQPDDALSLMMSGNFAYAAPGARFNGLGAAMLKRFGTDAGDFSQAVTLAAQGTDASALHTDAENQIRLSVRTASGATVELSLGSQDDGMAVQIKVSGGELSEAESKALVQLSDAFQEAIDGLSAFPPRMSLGGLTKFDPAVLSSIDFKADIKADGRGAINALAFHADAKSRSVSATGPSGKVKVDVDLSNPAILGSPAQQAQAMSRYLRQADAAGSRGRGDAVLVSMFKDAFSQMNSNYGVTAPIAGREAPGVIALNAGDHSLLSGLADFSASMVQTPNSSNPMRQDEVDTFSYRLSQSTSVTGKDPRNRSIHQDQQAQLSASFHRALSPGVSLLLTTAMESQSYEYVRIDDQSKVSADIDYEDGTRTSATATQSARESTRVQRYIMGRLESDITTPLERKRVSDVRQLLASVERADRSQDPEDARQRDQALVAAASLAALPDGPGTLPQARA